MSFHSGYGPLYALLVSPDSSDEGFFTIVLDQENWSLHAVSTLACAQAALKSRPFSLVITERDLPDGGWRDILSAAQRLPFAPLLVVTSRLADEVLWSEVLNLGGYDVLAKPLSRVEVQHVIDSAAWKCRSGPRIASRHVVVRSSYRTERAITRF